MEEVQQNLPAITVLGMLVP